MEFLVVDVKGSHTWTDTFAHFGTEGVGGVVGGATDVGYSCVEEVFRKFVGDFGDSTFAGEAF